MMAFAAALASTLAAQLGSLQSAARAFDDAQLHHDRAAIEAFLAPDFQYVTRKGQLRGRDAFLAATAAPGETLQPFVVADHRVLPLGPDGGIVSGDATLRGEQGGKAFADRFRYADVFARRAGRWVVVYTQVTTPPAP